MTRARFDIFLCFSGQQESFISPTPIQTKREIIKKILTVVNLTLRCVKTRLKFSHLMANSFHQIIANTCFFISAVNVILKITSKV